MTSGDNFVTVEMFNSGIQEIKSEIQQMRTELRQEIQEVKYQEQLNAHDTAHLQTSIYWGFAIMGVIIGLVGLVVAIIALNPFRREQSESKPEWAERDLRALVREEISMANSVARK